MRFRIAYQGIPGSNSQVAASLLVESKGIKSPVLVPRVSSERVIKSLLTNDCDYGVVAISNSTAGVVVETSEALKDVSTNVECSIEIPIIHCLYGRPSIELSDDRINHIFSHPQALAQCARNLKETYPNAVLNSMDDTALAAKSLAAGAYGDFSAVICSKQAGELYRLRLIKDNFQDNANNRTVFALIRLCRPLRQRAGFIDKYVIKQFASEKVVHYTTQIAIGTAILTAFLARDNFGWSSQRAAFALAGVTAGFVLFLTSDFLRNWLMLQQISGYWKYSVVPRFGEIPSTQKHSLNRVVRVDKGDDGFRIQGWWQGDGDIVRWESTSVLITHPSRLQGRLTYWYSNIDGDKAEEFEGVTSVSWTRGNFGEKVQRMHGWYLGTLNGDIGRITFERITEEQAHAIKHRPREVSNEPT